MYLNKVCIIAEAGVNHNGSLELALQLVDAAKAAGADVVKFQTFVTDNLVTKQAKKADYQQANDTQTSSQYQMLKSLELSFDQHMQVKAYCQRQNIAYLSTAFDLESLAFLLDDMELSLLKIPSGELTNAPFVLAHAQSGCRLIVSTGTANLEEITQALSVLAFGYLFPSAQNPSPQDFQQALASEQGQQLLKEKVILLHCTTEYPAPLAEINLNAIELLKETYDLTVGYSDHTEGLLAPTIAVAKGARIIEKHFTLDKSMPGPDHKASMTPQELTELVQTIRDTELAMGEKIKTPSKSELKNIAIVRKSLVAQTDIAKGDSFTRDNLVTKRPGSGMSPYLYWQVLGQTANRSYLAGDLIDE